MYLTPTIPTTLGFTISLRFLVNIEWAFNVLKHLFMLMPERSYAGGEGGFWRSDGSPFLSTDAQSSLKDLTGPLRTCGFHQNLIRM